MDLLLNLNNDNFKNASKNIKLMDAAGAVEKTKSSPIISKLARKIERIEPPVTRFFEAPGQMQSLVDSGEYDLVSVFKLLKYEPYFLKSVQKKLALLTKSGFSIHSDDDDIKRYFESRFTYMFMQTGKSLREIIRQVGYYLIACSNAYIIKVRKKDFPYAQSYEKDGKEMLPIIGLFVAHPTTMKPKYKVVKIGTKKNGGYKLEIDKWIHANKAGLHVEFDVDDVVHMTLLKEDGMLLGMPEVVPVVDDIRTLRKIEEDVQLLLYRDLFPIIHYQVENASIIDHKTGWTELDQARRDMQNIVQDGGIATDARHEIQFVGNDGNGVDAKPYLEYFRERVFTGLNVSASDMGLGQDISANVANSMSKQLTDAVRFIQQELSQQFSEQVLIELALQSPFPIEDLFQEDNIPYLRFKEPDIEWKIRKENHEGDLFAKGLKDIDEARAVLGLESMRDDQIPRTFQGLYGQLKVDQTTEASEHMAKVAVAAAPTTVKTATGTKQVGGAKDPGSWNNPTSTGIGKKSAADNDPIKAAKSNSNIVKSTRDSQEETSVSSISMQDDFKEIIKSSSKIDKIIITKFVYENIKDSVFEGIRQGCADACKDLELDSYNIQVSHNILDGIDKLCEDITNKLKNDESYLNRAAARISAAQKTEPVKAYNYGYALTCLDNNKDDLVVYSSNIEVSMDSAQHLGKKLKINGENILREIPPYRPNSSLKIKLYKE